MTIVYEEVSKRFGRATVVDRLNLSVEDGEMMVLLGPSGCGKTTSLRMLAGLETASGGSIYIAGRRVNDVPPRDRDVAMVFQNYALYPHMTVEQNIGYPLLVRRAERATIRGEVGRVARMLEIDPLLERRPRELSGGERQRVALARAVIRKPAAFLMDEPLSNLDARLRLQMRGELKRLQRELGITTVYVTHDQAEAMTLAHRVAVMRGGRLEAVGTPTELYRRPANRFIAGFLGSPPMNFVPGEIRDGRFAFEGGAIALPSGQTVAAGPVVAGFRPEAARLAAPDDGAFRGTVYVTEEMGAESFVFLECAGQLVTVRAEADFQAEIGDVLGVTVPSSALHFFDAASGRAVGR
ncbi:MAG: ABC transporter ATP-binding protein [Acidobacteria bacterium]|nr:MAG: ABC transporter ATP-binding protein [Acidobacteriota bacterium]